MKRPRKRFTEESQIHSAIDALIIKIGVECKMAEEQDKLADELYRELAKSDPATLTESERLEDNRKLRLAKEARKVADKLRAVQGRRKKELLALKETLARFKTAPMPFIEDNEVLAKIS